jgi:hypothetical protein
MSINVLKGRAVNKVLTRNVHILIYVCEVTGFLLVIALSWLGEFLDLPHSLFGFQATPVNYVESTYETVFVTCLAAVVLVITSRLFRKIRHLEGTLPVCAYCKRIRHGQEWIPIETYITRHSEATFTHSYCPECLEANYGKILTSKPTVLPDSSRPI